MEVKDGTRRNGVANKRLERATTACGRRREVVTFCGGGGADSAPGLLGTGVAARADEGVGVGDRRAEEGDAFKSSFGDLVSSFGSAFALTTSWTGTAGGGEGLRGASWGRGLGEAGASFCGMIWDWGTGACCCITGMSCGGDDEDRCSWEERDGRYTKIYRPLIIISHAAPIHLKSVTMRHPRDSYYPPLAERGYLLRTVCKLLQHLLIE